MPDLSVQWERIAEPQADHYDSDVTLRFARQRGYRPAQWAGGSNLLGGKVSIAGNNYWGAPLVPAQVDHPNVVKACDILAQWPAAFEQCQRLLSVIYIS